MHYYVCITMRSLLGHRAATLSSSESDAKLPQWASRWPGQVSDGVALGDVAATLLRRDQSQIDSLASTATHTTCNARKLTSND
jgi:hypothetical protein